MKLIVISDTHNHHKELTLPLGDILIHCGDFSSVGYHHEVHNFFRWFVSQPFQYKIVIAGNHDISFQKEVSFKEEIVTQYADNIMYLEDSPAIIDDLHFWGSPWQPEFNNWAWNLPRDSEVLATKWAAIPGDTNILITHSPPEGILDRCQFQQKGYPPHAGCGLLLSRVMEVGPRLHLFGHVHEGYGMVQKGSTTFVNASSCNLKYQPVNQPVVINTEDFGF